MIFSNNINANSIYENECATECFALYFFLSVGYLNVERNGGNVYDFLCNPFAFLPFLTELQINYLTKNFTL